MEKIFTFELDDFFSQEKNQVSEIAELLEDKLNEKGIKVHTPSNTDWGYVFTATVGKFQFDIIVKNLNGNRKSFGLSVTLRQNWLHRFIADEDVTAYENLCKKIMDSLISCNSFHNVSTYTGSDFIKTYGTKFLNL